MRRLLLLGAFFTFGLSGLLYVAGGGQAAASVSLTLMAGIAAGQVYYEFNRANLHGGIVYFCAVYFLIYGLKSIYVLLFSEYSFYAGSGDQSFSLYEPYFYSAIHVSTFCFALTIGVYNLFRMDRRRLPRPSSSRLVYQVAFLFAIISCSAFGLFIYVNGGIKFVVSVLSDIHAYRQGSIQVKLPILSVMVFVALYPLLLLYYERIQRKSLFGRGVILLIGLSMSYLQAGSVSQTVLFIISVFAIETYDRASRRDGLRYIVLWASAGSIIILISILLKFYFSATAQSSVGSSGIFKIFWEVILRHLLDVKVFFDFIFRKLNAIDVLAVEMRTFEKSADYFGIVHFIDGMFAFFPKSLVGLGDLTVPTQGNRFTDITGIGPKFGGINLSIVGAFYSISGIPTAMLGMALFGYLIARVEHRLMDNAVTGMEPVLCLTFSIYFVVYFVYTGTPKITPRRFMWFIITYGLIRVVYKIVRTATYRPSRPTATDL